MANILPFRAVETRVAALRPDWASASVEQPGCPDVGPDFAWWRARSGRRYVVDVHSSLAMERDDMIESVILAVAGDGRRALGVLAVEADLPEAERVAWLAAMAARGATSLHRHLLADSRWARRLVADDLAGGSRSQAA